LFSSSLLANPLAQSEYSLNIILRELNTVKLSLTLRTLIQVNF